MPRTDHDDRDIENMYEEISNTLHQEGIGHLNAIVIGDYNRIEAQGSTYKQVGPI
jgi:hypothetical protein